ncbi:hypothetical protein Droror1_Dr00017327 [Drosera rotundifolia]
MVWIQLLLSTQPLTGMRLAKEPDEFVKLLQQTKIEAAAAFGNDGVYLEKFIQNSRHIKFQVLADKYGNVMHFGERDCSIQRMEDLIAMPISHIWSELTSKL